MPKNPPPALSEPSDDLLQEDEMSLEEAPETPKRGRPAKRRVRRVARSSTYSSGDRANPRSTGLRKIHQFVEDACAQVALPPSPMGMVLPVTSTVFISRGPDFADRVVAIAENDERVYKMLLRASRYGAWLGLASIASTISVAVMVDLGSINRESFIAARTVGPEIEQVYGQRQQSNGQSDQHPAAAGFASAPTGWPNPNP